MSTPITEEDRRAAHDMLTSMGFSCVDTTCGWDGGPHQGNCDVIAQARADMRDEYNAAMLAVVETAALSTRDLSTQLATVTAERDALRDKVKNQARELSHRQDDLRRKNVALDALHWVWCDGGCAGGVHRYDHGVELTEDIVAAAERNAQRLRDWLDNKNGREEYRLADEAGKAALQAQWAAAWADRPFVLGRKLADAESRASTAHTEGRREALGEAAKKMAGLAEGEKARIADAIRKTWVAAAQIVKNSEHISTALDAIRSARDRGMAGK